MIDDSFNATIASVKSSMELLGLFDTGAEGRRIAVLGDVGHIGPDEIAEHAALAKAAENSPVDLVFTNGKLMRHMWDALPDRLRGTHTDTMPALFADLRERLRPGDVIALKSGRGTGGMGDREFLKLGKALRSGAQSWPAD